MAKILVIEDEKLHRTVVVDKLKLAGFSVESAQDGKEGIEKALFENPDLIVLDILMPVQDGRETLKILRSSETTKDIPVIVMTAIPEASLYDEEYKSVLSLANEVLQKDKTSLATLIMTINQLLNK